MTTRLEDDFHREMENLYHAAVELGLCPTYFLRMVSEHGGVATARRLLNASEVQPGLTDLWEIGRLDLSMEALVLQERWEALFSDEERQMARKRLEDHGYDPCSIHR